MSFALISFLVVILDQLFKFMMLRILAHGDSIQIIKGFFSLTLVYNTGAAFGILQGRKLLFIILPILTVLLIIILYIKSKEKDRLSIPLGFLMGGTLGNFIDRLLYGYVVDFFDLYYRSWHWPAFNIADSCICFGVFLLFFQTIRKKDASGPD